ncbi:MAG: hypothetical protein M3271_09100 [Actinomycetota bacterium]|nr:hypothetical protein [Actinomycetota bacterium]
MLPPKSVDEYLAAVPEEPRAALEQLRRTINVAAPDTIRFPVDKPLPRALVEKIVKTRIQEIDARGR